MRKYLQELFLSIAVFACSHINAQLTTGLVAYFKLNGNTTNSGSAAVTAVANNTTYTTNNSGVASSALQFAGTTSSYLSFVDNGNLDFTGDFSISFAIKLNTLAMNEGLYDNCLNYGGMGVWYFYYDHALVFYYKNLYIVANNVYTVVGQWKSVTAVRSAGTLILYVNGVQVASGPEGTATATYPYAPVAGQMYYFGTGGNYNPADGAIDEIRFYNRALSAAEAAQLSAFVLPLQMGNFTVSKQTDGMLLNWETLSEENTQVFEVERSSDGNTYSKIGSVQASGNSTTKKTYSYTDRTPLQGTNFYRLKIKDVNATYYYSRIVIIRDDFEQTTLQLFPNPVKNALQVQFSSQAKQSASITITNTSGATLHEENIQMNIGANAFSVATDRLAKGVYYLSVTTKEKKFTMNFIKD